ncbi:MAG TPA: PA14 domain-containing protein, partial [Polyangiaceae bacterium]
PQEGCACEQDRQVIDCGQVERRSAGYVSCSLGKRTCKDGAWGACIGDRVSMDISTTGSSKGLQSLGSAAPCVNNPCDPYCVNYIDDGRGIDGGTGLVGVDGGLSLVEGVGLPSQTTCTGMTLSPTPQSITVTSILPLVTSPSSLQYTIQLTPPGCASSTVPAAWTLSDNDICAIDATGAFNVYAPVAAAVQMTAYVATWQASAVANIKVDVHDTSQAPGTTASLFVGPGSGADTFTFLYPYANTVFPRALEAPVLQWDNGGAPAGAVKISLRYPASGTPTFNWSEIIPEGATPQATIPQEVWTAFDQTAKAQDAIIGIQRVVGGALRIEKTRPVHFSANPLRGLIYYTEYGRGPSNPAPSPAVGGTCSLPTQSAVIRALDPTSASPPVNPFATIAPGGCPVCHSVSANGRMFVTSNRGWGSGGGVSRINADGTFTLISDAPQPPTPGVDSRGFAFAAVSPDGTYVLQGSNLWGNTRDSGSTGVGSRLSGGNGSGLQGDYFGNQTLTGTPAVTRVDQNVNFDWAAGTPDPGVPADHFSVRFTGFVQPYSTETYTFTTETDEGVRLWVNDLTTPLIDHWVDQTTTQWSGTIALTAGVKYAIKMEYYENTGSAVAKLHWSSSTTTSEIIPEMQLYPPPQAPSNNGLTGAYYDGTTALAGAPTMTRVDNTVNFDWGGGSPGAPIGVDNFSVRWTGFVQPAYTETYSFQTATDDGVRLWVNGVQLVDNWIPQGTNGVCGSPTSAQYSGSIALTAGVKYPITMEYYEQGGGAAAELYWQSPSTACAPIPKSRLFQ